MKRECEIANATNSDGCANACRRMPEGL
ncbi:hypothetical protein LC608_02830 [Nostoc sp. XA010]|nr:hypothetical protein [Nostoc sp. XA010]